LDAVQNHFEHKGGGGRSGQYCSNMEVLSNRKGEIGDFTWKADEPMGRGMDGKEGKKIFFSLNAKTRKGLQGGGSNGGGGVDRRGCTAKFISSKGGKMER